MEQVQDFFQLIKYSSHAITVIVVIVGACLWLNGMLPVLYRLGRGLSNRKLALFARDSNLNELRTLLTDSKLFKLDKLIDIPSMASLGRAEKASIFVVQWEDWGENMPDILKCKADATAMIVWAPQAALSREQFVELSNHRNTTLVNFRGRLMNDLIISMITTSYEKK